MTIKRRSIIASAIAAASPGVLTGLGASLFSQTSNAQANEPVPFNSIDSDKYDTILTLVQTNNLPGPFNSLYSGMISAMVGIDFLQYYRRPINNGRGFEGKFSHWQAEYRKGKKYRKERVLLKVSFNAEDTGNLVLFGAPDGAPYNDIRSSGDYNSADTRVYKCDSLTYADPYNFNRRLWTPPYSSQAYPALSFNDSQLTVSEDVIIPGYRRTTFWAYTQNAFNGAYTYAQFYRYSLLLPTGLVNEPYRWYSRVVNSSDPWSTDTLLSAEANMRAYANVMLSRWGRMTFSQSMVHYYPLFAQLYVAQGLTQGLLINSAGVVLGGLFFFGYYDPNIWSNLGAAATSADRIAVTFTLNDVLYGSNGLVSNLLMGPNKFPISSNALFNNLSAPAGVNANTASLWAYGAPIDNNPVAASTSQCLVRAVDQL
jgi:hypothetical protein